MGALGASGPGYTTTLGGKELTFSAWTQGIMEAFEGWIFNRLRNETVEAGEPLRTKARRKFAEAKVLRDKLQDMDTNAMSPDELAAHNERFDDLAAEGQALQIEAREMLARIVEHKAAGAYHFYGALCVESREQFSGRTKVAHLCLLKAHPKITLAEVEALASTAAGWEALGEALREANDSKKLAAKSADSTPTPTTQTAAATTISEAAPTNASPATA